MKSLNMLKDYTLVGAILLAVGVTGTAQAIPISPAKSSHKATPTHHTTPVRRNTINWSDLFGPGVTTAAEMRAGAVDFSSSKLPEMRHLRKPPTTKNPKGGGTLTANVPDGGATAMMLGGTFSGMIFLRRKLPTRAA